MDSYFVHSPRWSNVIAEVRNAGSTKHARTAFLDYLSRNGMIDWRDRQLIRKQLMVKRGNPGEIGSTIVLDYSKIGPEAQSMYVEREVENMTVPPPQVESIPPPSTTVEMPRSRPSGMPIAAAARRLSIFGGGPMI